MGSLFQLGASANGIVPELRTDRIDGSIQGIVRRRLLE
jgi:hypothetical protein